MSRDPENFEQLCRLLKLKRYEQPPPGYFHQFSGQVIARIKLGDGAREADFFERVLWDSPWLHRIFSLFEARPAIAGAFGVAMCALLVSGVVYSEKAEVQPMALLPIQESAPAAPHVKAVLNQSRPLLADLEASSTNQLAGFANDGTSLGGIPVLRASFTFSGGN